MVSLTGILENFIFKNDETEYGVANFICVGEKEKKVIVGSISSFNEGSFLSLETMKVESSYGTQYKVMESLPAEPFGEEGIKSYIKSKFYGIGDKKSNKILETFGEDVINILDKDPSEINKVVGLHKKEKNIIIKEWKNERLKDGISRSLIISLRDGGFGIKKINKLVSFINNVNTSDIMINPYILMSIADLNFKTVDNFALKIGILKDNPIRIENGISYFSINLLKNGDCYMKMDEFKMRVKDELKINEDNLIEEGLKTNISKENVEIINVDGIENIMPDIYSKAEKNLSEKINKLLSTKSKYHHMDIDSHVNYIVEKSAISISDEQIDAIKKAITEKFSIITGGPGTGKTTILNVLIQSMKMMGNNVEIKLMAPTGKAAKRMSKSTNLPASTIHRAVSQVEKGSGYIEADIIVIDEASMIDIILMDWLMTAISDDTVVIIVGDVDQLPSVSAGQVLKDLILSKNVPSSRLTKVFRFEEGYIKRNAFNINNGNSIELPGLEDKDSDFYFMQYPTNGMSSDFYADKICECILKLNNEIIPNKKNADKFEDIQVLVPMNMGVLGVTNLNQRLQNKLNPTKDKNSIILYNENKDSFRVNDKVMQIKNNYSKNIFNGDVGRVISINNKNKEIVVEYDIGKILYKISEFHELNLSYASSIHKSQGSEYKYLILPFYMGYFNMLERKLLYTAVTRAREMVILIGDPNAVDKAIKNNDTSERKTFLKQRLSA